MHIRCSGPSGRGEGDALCLYKMRRVWRHKDCRADKVCGCSALNADQEEEIHRGNAPAHPRANRRGCQRQGRRHHDEGQRKDAGMGGGREGGEQRRHQG